MNRIDSRIHVMEYNIPRKRMAAAQTFNRDKKEMDALRRWFLTNIMPYTVGDKSQQKSMLNVEAMRILDRAFTSKTAVYDISKNYEQYETLGDSLIAYLTEVVVLEKFPHADSGDISNMKGEYASNKYQAYIMHKLNASRYLVKAPNTDLTRYGILGDVFESMFYAIFLVVKLSYPNLAYNACYNLFKHLYDNPEFIVMDFKYSKGNAKTVIMTKLLGKLRDRQSASIPKNQGGPSYTAYIYETETIVGDNATISVTIDLPKMTLFKTAGIDVSTPISAQATSASSGVASTAVYLDLLTQMEARGITEEAVEEIKLQTDIKDPIMAPVYRAAITTAVRHGYNKLEFDVDEKLSKSIGENAKVLLLLGKKANGSIDVLMCAIGSQNTTETKMGLLQAYSRGEEFQMLDFRRR